MPQTQRNRKKKEEKEKGKREGRKMEKRKKKRGKDRAFLFPKPPALLQLPANLCPRQKHGTHTSLQSMMCHTKSVQLLPAAKTCSSSQASWKFSFSQHSTQNGRCPCISFDEWWADAEKWQMPPLDEKLTDKLNKPMWSGGAWFHPPGPAVVASSSSWGETAEKQGPSPPMCPGRCKGCSTGSSFCPYNPWIGRGERRGPPPATLLLVLTQTHPCVVTAVPFTSSWVKPPGPQYPLHPTARANHSAGPCWVWCYKAAFIQPRTQILRR